MRIEEGKYYRAANGEKIGPMTNYGHTGDKFPWAVGDLDFMWWNDDGLAQPDTLAVDLISEWTEGPVRTVQRIIPGTYDGVVVGNVGASGVQVSVRIDDGWYDAVTLERAAAVLTALAGALRDAS